MPRLFYGNFDFEESLVAPPGRRRSRATERILAELASAWVSVVEEGDTVWSPGLIDDSFRRRLRTSGWPEFQFISCATDIPEHLTFEPWGWTPEAIAFAESVGAVVSAPPTEAIRIVNSRQFALDISQTLGVAISAATGAGTIEELEAAVRSLWSQRLTAVVKGEFGYAGRNMLRVSPYDHETFTRVRAWAQSQLESGQRLFIEPQLDRVAEAGLQYDIAPGGAVRFVGVGEMLPTRGGRYTGSVIKRGDDPATGWRCAIDVGFQVCRAVSAIGYFGPLGIDAMLYRFRSRLELRAIQDINARWTMGRLALGFRRFLRKGQRALWVHGPLDKETIRGVGENSVAVIHTSPEKVSGEPVRHSTALAIIGPNAHEHRP